MGKGSRGYKGGTIEQLSEVLAGIYGLLQQVAKIAAVNETSSDWIITELGKIFGRLGYPKTLVSDNDKQLVSQKTTKFLKSNGIEPRRVPLYAPNQNDFVERFNRVISEKLRSMNVSGGISRKHWKKC